MVGMTRVKDLENKQKILIIRMQSVGDVSAIGLPALRFFKQRFEHAEIHFLTFAQGQSIIELAEPSIKVFTLAHWPDDFFQAMEAFLGLAESIIGEGYQQIVNLDTAFMPCFLSRFLKDAGEPIAGNYLSIAIEPLLKRIQTQSLQADFVNQASHYCQSSFFNMSRWFTPWWNSSTMPDGGYPEFYLKQCCGFSKLDMDSRIERVSPRTQSSHTQIAFAFDESEDGYAYPYADTLATALKAKGFTIVEIKASALSIANTLNKLANSALLVAKPNGVRWLANHVDCPVLLVSGAAQAQVYMPDYATDTSLPCAKHANAKQDVLSQTQPCNCDEPQQLADNIESIVKLLAEKQSDA